MKKCYLDTNILIAHKIEESPHFSISTTLIQKMIEEEAYLYISPLTIDEFLHPMKYFLGLKYTKVYLHLKKAVKDIISFPNLSLVNPPAELKSQMKVINFMERFKLRPRDAFHLLIMQTNGIEYFATLDTDFKTVFEKKVIQHFEI